LCQPIHIDLIAISSAPETRPFMPRDNDKDNASSRGRRDRPSGGKGRSGAARGPEKKFAKRDFAGKGDGEKRPYAGKPYAGKSYADKSDGAKSYGKKPYSGPGKPYAGKREGPPPRRDGDAPRRDYGDRKDFRPREDRGGEKRPFTPRGDRPNFNRDDRPARSDRGDARPAARFSEKKFGDKKPYAPREGGGEKRPYTPRGEGFRKDGDRPRGDRPERKFGGDKKFSRGAPDRGPRKDFGSRSDRGPRKDFGADRGESKPDAIRVLPATAPEILTSLASTSRVTTNRARTAAAMSVRAFRARAGIVPRVIVHFASGRSLIVPAKGGVPGRNIRAATRSLLIDLPIGPAATTKTTARSL
jgi:hypothetical protein